MKKIILKNLFLLLFTLGVTYGSFAQIKAVYAGGGLSQASSIEDLRDSGFNTVIAFTIHIFPNGDLYWNNTLMVSNGSFLLPDLKTRLNRLMASGSSVTRLEFCVGSAGSGTYNSVRDFYNNRSTNDAFASNGILYRNFKALKDNLPISAINNDDEVTYDVNSAVHITKMWASLGLKNTIAPYRQTSFWSSLVSQVNASYSGNMDRNYLQCYAGGGGNSPCQSQWNFGITNVGGLWGGSGQMSPSQVQTTMTGWKNTCGANGGFLWIYSDFNVGSYQYADAVQNAFSSSATCYAPTPYVASKGQTNINVGWYNTNANSYALYYKKDSAGSWTWGGYHNGLSANITGLSASTKYNIDVYSVCSSGSWILGDRLTVTTSGSSSGGGGGSNIAQGKPFGVSSTYGSGYEGWRSNDGNGNTRWASSASGATTQQYVYYDLGAYYNISSVRLYFENAYSKNFNIQIGVNGYWQNVTGLTNNSNLSPGLGINRTARWIRFVSTNHPRSLVSIWEFEVQGSYAYAGKKANGKESVPLEPLGLNDVTFSKDVKVFPNPANSTFNIALKGFKKADITISDLLGKTVYKTSTTNSEISLTKGNTFKTGMYIIRVMDENANQYTSKLIIN